MDEYIYQLNELTALLEQEQEALMSRDYTCLNECTERKNALLEKLAVFEVELQSMKNPGQQDEITSLLKKCRELNEINGGIIEVSRQFNQRMLRTILGGSGEGDNTYDAGGQNAGMGPSQVVARI